MTIISLTSNDIVIFSFAKVLRITNFVFALGENLGDASERVQRYEEYVCITCVLFNK